MASLANQLAPFGFSPHQGAIVRLAREPGTPFPYEAISHREAVDLLDYLRTVASPITLARAEVLEAAIGEYWATVIDRMAA